MPVQITTRQGEDRARDNLMAEDPDHGDARTIPLIVVPTPLCTTSSYSVNNMLLPEL